MKILAADDEEGALDELVYAIQEAVPTAEVVSFSIAREALEYVKSNPCDIAFLDIEMPEIDGIALAKRMKSTHPSLNIIFVTGYSDYGLDAYRLHASGYVLKPVTKKAVLEEVQNLRFPVKREATGIRAVTFGEFELYAQGEQVRFGRAKSKEMLAYLIDQHGRVASKKEIAVILFEDQVYSRAIQDYMKKITADLRDSLQAYGAEDILRVGYNSYSVDPDQFSCDLYEYEKGQPAAINAFGGKYMSQYSWSEDTLGTLI